MHPECVVQLWAEQLARSTETQRWRISSRRVVLGGLQYQDSTAQAQNLHASFPLQVCLSIWPATASGGFLK